jgi:hypothetical protein
MAVAGPVSCPADPQRHETAQTDSDQQQQVQQQQQGAPPVQRERDLVIPVAVSVVLRTRNSSQRLAESPFCWLLPSVLYILAPAGRVHTGSLTTSMSGNGFVFDQISNGSSQHLHDHPVCCLYRPYTYC